MTNDIPFEPGAGRFSTTTNLPLNGYASKSQTAYQSRDGAAGPPLLCLRT